jgi:hypothetical protein
MEAPIRKVDGIEREDADAIRPTRSALDCRRAGNCGALDGHNKGAIDYGLDENTWYMPTPVRIRPPRPSHGRGHRKSLRRPRAP